jgi:hypothetical protein
LNIVAIIEALLEFSCSNLRHGLSGSVRDFFLELLEQGLWPCEAAFYIAV